MKMLSRQLLSLGASEPWPEILLEFTGSDKVDASAILEYFQPLDEWLDQVSDQYFLLPTPRELSELVSKAQKWPFRHSSNAKTVQ